MRFISVCSGIEAASCAWHPLGWRAVWFSEIEPFPSVVLAHHYTDTPNLGDMTKFKEWPDANVDVLVGGTPCQSFSVAGLRKGLDDPRGNLMLTYLAIAARYRPKWLVWENVPGVLSSNGGRDFGSFLGGLAVCGYGFAYRVLDAQYFGLAQRRRRVFVVGCFGDWHRAAAVLFERHSLQGHPAPSRKAGKVAPTIPARSLGGGGLGTDFDCDGGLIHREIAPALTGNYGKQPDSSDTALGPMLIAQPHADISPAIKARDHKGASSDGDGAILVPMVAHSLRADGFDASEDGTGRGTPLVPVAFDWQGGGKQGDLGAGKPGVGALGTTKTPAIAGVQVRRLLPIECERLQGFPDGWTDVPFRGKPAADGPRYKALGNSMAVPCMSWIGRRIAMVDAIQDRMAA